MSQTQLDALTKRLGEFFFGQAHVIEHLLAALITQQHVLLEGPPGTAKTLLAQALAGALGLGFSRIQMTPDLLPGDILGTSVWLPQEGRFEFRAGPIFTQILLSDEINRAPPKTQAALLEAMQEKQVTMDGQSRPLDQSFWVVATQNPSEHEGTFPLPESQLDRFGLKVLVDYPADAVELQIVAAHTEGQTLRDKALSQTPVLDAQGLLLVQQAVDKVRCDESLAKYAQQIVATTRSHPDLRTGAGPRATLALLHTAQALALIRGRDYVIPDDIQDLAENVLAHRVRVVPEAQVAGESTNSVIQKIIAAITPPKSFA